MDVAADRLPEQNELHLPSPNDLNMNANHHAHTRYSDGIGEPEDYIRAALATNFTSYGFSDHAPIPRGDRGSMKMAELPAYVRETERLRAAYAGQLKVFRSLEVDYIPDVINVASPHIQAADLDYTVGAVHYVDYLEDGRPWSFQQRNPTFERGIDTIFGGDARRMVERYYALVREMIERHPPDILAHLDRIKRRNGEGRYWDEEADWYVKTVEETLDAVQAAGLIMEVNTRGIYLGETTATFPSQWIVRRAHERGIRLQVNSDAHAPHHIDGAFEQAFGMLRQLGVKEVWTYDGERFAPGPY